MNTTRYIQELFEEGFNEDSIRAVYLIPLVDTAWADGKIQTEERREILALMKEREIRERSEAYKLIDSWLTRKPTEEFFANANNLIEPLFRDLKENRGGDIMWVIKALERVANATGNSASPMSRGEKKVIRAILDRLSFEKEELSPKKSIK